MMKQIYVVLLFYQWIKKCVICHKTFKLKTTKTQYVPSIILSVLYKHQLILFCLRHIGIFLFIYTFVYNNMSYIAELLIYDEYVQFWI